MIPTNAIQYFTRIAEMHGASIKIGEFLDPEDGSARPMIYIYGDDPSALRKALQEDIRKWWLDKPGRDFGVSITRTDWEDL